MTQDPAAKLEGVPCSSGNNADWWICFVPTPSHTLLLLSRYTQGFVVFIFFFNTVCPWVPWEFRWPAPLHRYRLPLILSAWTLTIIFHLQLGAVMHSHTVLSQPLYFNCRRSRSVWSPVWVIAVEQQHEISVGGLCTVCGPLAFLIHE